MGSSLAASSVSTIPGRWKLPVLERVFPDTLSDKIVDLFSRDSSYCSAKNREISMKELSRIQKSDERIRFLRKKKQNLK